MVVLEHSAKSFAAFNPARGATDLFIWFDELVAKSLMVAFGVIVLNEIGHGSFK